MLRQDKWWLSCKASRAAACLSWQRWWRKKCCRAGAWPCLVQFSRFPSSITNVTSVYFHSMWQCWWGGGPAGRLCMGSCPCKLCLLHPAYPQSKLEDVTDEFTFVSTGGCDHRRFRLSLNYLTWKISSGPFAVPVKLSLPVCGEVELGVRLAQEPVLVWRRGTLGRWQRIPCCSYLEGQCSDHHSLMDLMSYLALNYIPFLKSLVSALLFLYPGLLFSPFFFLSIVENTNRVYENWKTLGLPSLYNQQS